MLSMPPVGRGNVDGIFRIYHARVRPPFFDADPLPPLSSIPLHLVPFAPQLFLLLLHLKGNFVVLSLKPVKENTKANALSAGTLILKVPESEVITPPCRPRTWTVTFERGFSLSSTTLPEIKAAFFWAKTAVVSRRKTNKRDRLFCIVIG